MINEVTRESEKKAGWDSEPDDIKQPSEAVDPGKEPANEPPVELPVEAPVVPEVVEDGKKDIPEPKEGQEEKKDAPEPKEGQGKEVEKDSAKKEPSGDYRLKWLSQQGIVKSEKTKREAAEKRIAELEAQLKEKPVAEKPKEEKPESNEEEALQEEYEEARIDGDKEKAREIYRKIRKLQEERMISEIDKRAAEKTSTLFSQKTEEERVSSVIEKSIKEYPFLNHESEDKNPYAIKLVNTVTSENVASGMDFPTALSKAIEEVAPLFEEVRTEPKKPEPIAPPMKVSARQAPVTIEKTGKRFDTKDDGWNSY